MAGIASIIGATAAVAGAGAGIAGAAGAGGGQMTRTQKKYNDWLAANNYVLGNKQNKWLKQAEGIANSPEFWTPYNGQRVADFSGDQQAAFDKTRQTAGGDPYLSGAQNQVNKTLNGDYLNYQTPTNPYMGNAPSASNGFIGQNPSSQNQFIGSFGNYQNAWEGKQPTGTNAYLGATNKYEGAQNAYLGATNKYEGARTDIVNNPMLGLNNPYLNNAIDYAAGDTIRNYQKAITPSTDAAFARAGAFGGSAWGEQTAENQRNLANELGRQANTARMNDYQTQQQLMNQNAQFQTGINQSDLARNAGLVSTDLSRNAGLSSDDLQRNSNLVATDLARNSQLAENQLNREQDAWKTNASLNSDAARINQNTWQNNLASQQNANSLASQNWQTNLGAQQNVNSLANSQWATNAGLAQNQIDNNLRNYMAERGYQQNGINNALNLHNQGYTDANNLLQIGNQQQTQNQNLINADMQHYQENQNFGRAPIEWMLGNYQSAMGQMPQPSFSQQAKTNPYMGALGGAIGGYQLGSGLGKTFGGLSDYFNTSPATSYRGNNLPPV